MVNNIMFVIAIIILGFIALIWIPKWMLKRNIKIVLRIFKEENAIGIQNARTAEELGLVKTAMLQAWSKGKIFNRRDWKPYALRFLIDSNIVFVTDEGKLYVTEKSLDSVSLLTKNKK